MQFPDVAKRQGKSRSEDVVTKQTVEGSGSPEILVAYICGYINGYMMLYDVIWCYMMLYFIIVLEVFGAP